MLAALADLQQAEQIWASCLHQTPQKTCACKDFYPNLLSTLAAAGEGLAQGLGFMYMKRP